MSHETFRWLMMAAILPVLGFAVILAALRLAWGPTLPDRVVAFDLMATTGIGIAAVYAMATDEPVVLDVGIVLALVSFIGTVAFANYLQKRD